MGILRIGDLTSDLQAGGASWAPMTGGNTLGTTPPAMAPGYDDGTDGTVVGNAVVLRSQGRVRLSSSELSTLQADQSLICRNARVAQDRNSPAAPGLISSCLQLRAANFAKGIFLVEPVPTDPAYRVQLTDAGKAIVDASPQLSSLYASLVPNEANANQRMFLWAAAVAKGQAAPGYTSFLFGPAVGGGNAPITADRSGQRREFERFLRMFAGTQNAAAAGGEDGPSLPLIGAGVAGVALAGFLVWKFLL